MRNREPSDADFSPLAGAVPQDEQEGLGTRVVELRQLNSSDLSGLLEEEKRFWNRELFWDYSSVSALISKCLDERQLRGYGVFENSAVKGYGFFVLEGKKATVGNLFVSHDVPRAEYAQLLLDHLVETLQQTPGIERIEAQLPPFTCEELSACFRRWNFAVFPRRFMVVSLESVPEVSIPLGKGMEFRPWESRYEGSLALLLHEAYREHVDSAINLQYHSQGGTLQVIENVTKCRGCGEFERQASLVALHVPSGVVCGGVLATSVGAASGHIPQICISPPFQGCRIGTALLHACFHKLRARRYREVSLTVTEKNARAVRLYDKLGFRTHRGFGAYVWNRQGASGGAVEERRSC